ncbi:ATP-dependent helicase [Williamsia sp. CHRR-6]|nr:ATP-dependent helicase [Williamsia sp. CHRR-6]
MPDRPERDGRRRSEVRARLVAAPGNSPPPRVWPQPVQALVDGPVETPAGWAPHRVSGGPGTGKTALLVDIAVARLTDPSAAAESVMVLAANRRAAAALREQISARVLGVAQAYRADRPLATREPLVRTVHSYAFAVLRLQAAALGNPPPRLITGSEQDAVIRELLAGDIDDGAGYWPAHLRPALPTDGFAQALRDLMLRSAERGVGPEGLIALGRKHNRPEWVAAGQAYRQYEQTTLLRGAVGVESPHASAPAVDAAELIGSALTALSTDEVLCNRERARIRHLLVDDAQHLDPHAAALIRLIGTGAQSVVIAGDPDQAIYGFRGASSRFLDSLAEPGSARDIRLTDNFRSGAAITAVGTTIAARLPGGRRTASRPAGPDPVRGSGLGVQVHSSAAKEATAIADMMRRAHLFDAVPWSQMAVIVRSVPRALTPLRRALRSAGVPVTTSATELPLHRQRAVRALLGALRAAEEPIDPDSAFELLAGPIGAADPTAIRRLRRGVRRVEAARAATGVMPRDSGEVIAAMLADPRPASEVVAGLTDPESLPLVRVLDVIAAVRASVQRGGGVEDVLWSAWQATRLERRWAAVALRGGAGADQADRDLDAVVALFDAAASFTDNLPAATVVGFVEHIEKLQIPTETRRVTADSDAVTVLSAHSAAGREWDVVAVAGVVDGLWPSLRSRGSILSTPALVDLLDGMSADALDTVSRGAVALAEERRLFLVACTRARRALLVTAVDDGSGDSAPSRFVSELALLQSDSFDSDPDVDCEERELGDVELPVQPAIKRVLSLPSLTATLRAAVCDPASDKPTVAAAAELLARLADAAVEGAHPAQWYGLSGPSTDVALWNPDRGPLVLSPSGVESLSRCSLRWMLERAGGRDGDAAPAVAGTLVHTMVQAVAGQIPPAEVTESLRRVWEQVDLGADWYSAHELERTEAMLTTFSDWLRRTRDELTEIGVEVEVDVIVPADPVAAQNDPESGDIPVRLRGRIDRLERDAAGRPVVVDVKTAKSAIPAADAQVHPQLATYQLALTLGGEPTLGPVDTGGAQLVYVAAPSRTTGATVRSQDPLTPEQIDEWTDIVRAAARAAVGPRFEATRNPSCSYCPLHTSCPAQTRGRSVADD